MRRISGLVLAASLLLPVSFARAAEVTHLYTNNQFANAVSTDNAGNSIGVFVTREKGKGAPRDSIFVIFSDTFGNSAFISGTLPKNAFKVSAKKASVDVDIDDIDVTSESGTLPDGVISVDWAATDVTRTSGNTKLQFGNTTVSFVGHLDQLAGEHHRYGPRRSDLVRADRRPLACARLRSSSTSTSRSD